MTGLAQITPAHTGPRGDTPAGDHATAAGDHAMAAGDHATAASAVRQAVRRRRWPVLVAMLVIISGVAGALIIPSGTQGTLDPRSVSEQGSRAVAQLLRAHGVRVDLVQRSTAAVTGAGTDTTIVVVDTLLLGPVQLDRLRATPADLVLVEPDQITLQALAPQAAPAGVTSDRSAPPGCQDPDAVAAGVTTAGGLLYRAGSYRVGTPGSQVTTCYRDGAGWSMLRIDTGGRRVTVLGQSAVLSNAGLADAGNAALALRVLGARPDLRWYLPDPAELIGSKAAPTLSQLLPSWVRPVSWQLIVVAVLALLWRSRRLGRLVTEPLPVVVRSAETQEGRARLYRQAGAVDLAAATLRTAAVRRLAIRLSVATTAEPRDVVRLAAAASARTEADLHEIMLGAPPSDAVALVRLAAALDAVEDQVAGTSGQSVRQDAAPQTAQDREVGPR